VKVVPDPLVPPGVRGWGKEVRLGGQSSGCGFGGPSFGLRDCLGLGAVAVLGLGLKPAPSELKGLQADDMKGDLRVGAKGMGFGVRAWVRK